MAKHTSKAKPKNTTKTVSITAGNFVIHPLASKPYQIYCELFPITKPKQNRMIVTVSTPLFDVIKGNTAEGQEIYYFFDNFASVALLEDKENIMIRELDSTAIDIKRRSWEYLLNAFLDLKPINPMIFQAINTTLPTEIAEEIFGEKLMIKQVLDELDLERHHYDYRTKLQRENKPHLLPAFSDLIIEAQDERG